MTPAITYRRAATLLTAVVLMHTLESPVANATQSVPATDLMIESTGLSWTTLVLTGVGAAAILSILQWRRHRNDSND